MDYSFFITAWTVHSFGTSTNYNPCIYVNILPSLSFFFICSLFLLLSMDHPPLYYYSYCSFPFSQFVIVIAIVIVSSNLQNSLLTPPPSLTSQFLFVPSYLSNIFFLAPQPHRLHWPLTLQTTWGLRKKSPPVSKNYFFHLYTLILYLHSKKVFFIL